MKYMKATLLREESDPEKGRYCFLLLDSGDETIGKDDFVPGTGRTYEVTVEVYGEDGSSRRRREIGAEEILQ